MPHSCPLDRDHAAITSRRDFRSGWSTVPIAIPVSRRAKTAQRDGSAASAGPNATGVNTPSARSAAIRSRLTAGPHPRRRSRATSPGVTSLGSREGSSASPTPQHTPRGCDLRPPKTPRTWSAARNVVVTAARNVVAQVGLAPNLTAREALRVEPGRGLQIAVPVVVEHEIA